MNFERITKLSIRSSISAPVAASLALLIVMLVYTISAGISVDYLELHIHHADSSKIYPIGGVYGDNWNSFRWEPFSRGISIGFWLLCFFYYGLVASFGYAAIKTLVGKHGFFPIQFGAGFLLGYPAVVAINRIVTLVFSDVFAPYVIAAVLILLTIALLKLASHDRFNKASVHQSQVGIKHFLLVIGIVLTTLFLLIYEIQNGRNFMVHDSTIGFLLPEIGEYLSKFDGTKQFPLVNQQYDELLFNYPLWVIDSAANLSIVPFWLTNALAKSSFMFLVIFLLGNQLGSAGKWVIISAATYIMFGSSGAIPWYHVSLFGAQNPLLYGGYPGRLLGLMIPLLVVAFFEYLKGRSNPLSLWQLGVVALVTLGLSGLSVNIGVYLIAAMGIATLAHSTTKIQHGSLPVIACFLITPFLVYRGVDASKYSPLLLIPVLVGVFWSLIAVNWRKFWVNFRPLAVPGLVISGSLLIGWVFLGNILSFKLVDLGLLRFGPYGEGWLVRHAASIPESIKWFEFSGDINSNTKHWLSPTYFAAFYGTGLILITGGITLAHFKETAVPTQGRYFQYFLGCTVCLLFGFLYTDFVVDGNNAWIKNRMIEIPFYSAILFMAFLLAKLSSSKVRWIFSISLLLWSSISFFSNYGIQQFVVNATYLKNFISGQAKASVVGAGDTDYRVIQNEQLFMRLSNETHIEISAPHDGIYRLGEFVRPTVIGRYQVALNMNQHSDGRDPIMQLGQPGQGDLIFLDRSGNNFRVGIDHWGNPTAWSNWQTLINSTTLTLDIRVADKIEVFEVAEANKQLLVTSPYDTFSSSLLSDYPVFGENRIGFTTTGEKARFNITQKKLSSKMGTRIKLRDSWNERDVTLSESCPTINLRLKRGLNLVRLKGASDHPDLNWQLRDYVFLPEASGGELENCGH